MISNLFWVSENLNLDQKDVSPSVPKNFLTQKGIIDKKIKRILLYDSLDDAISVYSLGGKDLSGITLGVYRPRFLHRDNRIEPGLSNCPYALVLDGKEYWCLLSVEMIKIADIKIGEKIGEKDFGASDRTRKQTHLGKNKLGIYSWSEILPEWDKKGKTMKLKRKTFGTTADRVTKDKPVAREIGTIAGSAGLGLASGLAIHGLTKDGTIILDRATYKPIKKVVEENGKKVKKVVELKERPRVARIAKRLRPTAEKIEKFAKTKGGKAALIGIPTAVIGGVVYKSAKKKDKKKK